MGEVKEIDAPASAEEVCHFIHSSRWMSNSILDFNKSGQPFNDIVENAYANRGKWKKSALQQMYL